MSFFDIKLYTHNIRNILPAKSMKWIFVLLLRVNNKEMNSNKAEKIAAKSKNKHDANEKSQHTKWVYCDKQLFVNNDTIVRALLPTIGTNSLPNKCQAEMLD